MAFTIVADIEEARMEKDVLKLAEKYFGNEGPEAGLSETRLSTPAAEPFEKTISKRNHQANCVIGAEIELRQHIQPIELLGKGIVGAGKLCFAE